MGNLETCNQKIGELQNAQCNSAPALLTQIMMLNIQITLLDTHRQIHVQTLIHITTEEIDAMKIF